MREYTAWRGWTIALQVREIGSGASQREEREQLLDAARRREIDVMLVWKLDRREMSVSDLPATLQELEHLDVGFVSLTEALDLTTPTGRAMVCLLAVFADDAKCAIMQSHNAETSLWPAGQWFRTLHNPRPTSETTNTSHSLIRPSVAL